MEEVIANVWDYDYYRHILNRSHNLGWGITENSENVIDKWHYGDERTIDLTTPWDGITYVYHYSDIQPQYRATEALMEELSFANFDKIFLSYCSKYTKNDKWSIICPDIFPHGKLGERDPVITNYFKLVKNIFSAKINSSKGEGEEKYIKLKHHFGFGSFYGFYYIKLQDLCEIFNVKYQIFENYLIENKLKLNKQKDQKMKTWDELYGNDLQKLTTASKTCTCCNITYPLSEFSKSQNEKDGLNRYCVGCANHKMGISALREHFQKAIKPEVKQDGKLSDMVKLIEDELTKRYDEKMKLTDGIVANWETLNKELQIKIEEIEKQPRELKVMPVDEISIIFDQKFNEFLAKFE